ncbi:MBL fold metallo-hydrolase [Paraburkholderia sp.]|uniref:MBL fold metallo-hydrolase n=1 Tax=Paraburkholderia sp. TaxID=1926495 RepID=UPI0039E25C00
MQYTSGPAHDEPEVVVFGPGYGEAIAVHLGDNQWLLVDSCRNPATRAPASLEYLQRIGVDPARVLAVVASHWHDDHVRGLSALLDACSNAELFISGVFNDREAMAFLAAYSGRHTSGLSRGTRELYDSVDRLSSAVVPATHRTLILEQQINGKAVMVAALSPTTEGQAKTLEHFLSYVPSHDGGADDRPINHAPDLQPNMESVVVHVDLGDDAILLGSDLEHHGLAGWHGIVESKFGRARRPASVYKVAHHGSITAEYQGIWDVMLRSAPTSVLTPFINGSVKLPKDADRSRIRAVSGTSFISSGASRRALLDRDIEKRLDAMCSNLTPVNNGFGAVRVRRNNGVWSSTLFGDAMVL